MTHISAQERGSERMTLVAERLQQLREDGDLEASHGWQEVPRVRGSLRPEGRDYTCRAAVVTIPAGLLW